MTGAEVIARLGKKVALVKVRSDGYDVMDIIPTLPLAQLQPVEVCRKYLQAHNGSMSSFGLSCQLKETQQLKVFEFEYDGPELPLEEMHEALVEHAHKLIRNMGEDEEGGEWEGYSCSYSDYQVLIDCAAGTWWPGEDEEDSEEAE